MTTLYKACQSVRVTGMAKYWSAGKDLYGLNAMDYTQEVCSPEYESGIAARNALQSLIRGECFGIENCKIDYLSEINLTSREVGMGARILHFWARIANKIEALDLSGSY